MDTNIRYYIINNFKGDDFSTLKNAIEESIKEQDELILPGLGVFFELVWENADQELKNQIRLYDNLKERAEYILERTTKHR